MAIIPIDLLEAGMILKADVRDRSGRLILPAEAELAEKQIKIFRTWGVTEADILHGPDGTDIEATRENSEIDPVVLAAAEQAVDEIFRLNDVQHPVIKELMRVCLARRLTIVAQ
ncbi:MAG: hypothetical protein PHY09_08795 [Desulfuromonadaceae bacterium]|nr:hypothetical protein [Desulfuromonadaceae bacterium]MDD5107533.1 hypothetical protein [Desulfuromonadaceae bacterium]